MVGQATGLWQQDRIRCKYHVLAALYSWLDLGTIYTNVWHTVSTYLRPIFWALLDNAQLLMSLDKPPHISFTTGGKL